MSDPLALVIAAIVAGSFIAIGVQNLVLPKKMTYDAMNYPRDSVVWPIRVIIGPITRIMASRSFVLIQRLTGVMWIATGVVAFYFLMRFI